MVSKTNFLTILTTTFSILVVAVCLFLPMMMISLLDVGQLNLEQTQAEEVTVGIAVILRATARRLMRTGARNLLRTTFGTFSRASARALTRRFVRVSAKATLAGVVRDMQHPSSDEALAATVPEQSLRGKIWAIGLGYVGLAASFYGVLSLLGSAEQLNLTKDTFSPLTAALLAGAPLIVYCLIALAACRYFNVKVQFSTPLDGLLLQGYFTGAGSFLPMTTDLEYHGEKHQRTLVAASVLGGMYSLHLLFFLCHAWTGLYLFEFVSFLFLIYCFVYSFPIKPLEGYHVWRERKGLWFALWVPILISFFALLPEEFTNIL